ncbi:hypothetical protein CYJ44_012200 [Corynebacterium hesseae]|uniref:Uncharacterized protein n=1 Tax=Corynebacterium hesseae TaxID=2913502 RepID=A0ABU9UMH9_9CORY
MREQAQHLKQELDDYAQQQAQTKANAEAETQTNTDSGEDIPF